jgi:hypothetical protein
MCTPIGGVVFGQLITCQSQLMALSYRKVGTYHAWVDLDLFVHHVLVNCQSRSMVLTNREAETYHAWVNLDIFVHHVLVFSVGHF